MHEDDLTPAEREALRALPREANPSELLEERTVRALAARGMIRPSRALPPWFAWAAAAAYAPNSSSMLWTDEKVPVPSTVLLLPKVNPPPVTLMLTSALCPLSQVIFPVPFAVL
jgi:hypothetical protein